MKCKFILLAIAFSGVVLLMYCQVYAQEARNFSGYAWSDQTGWISFSCKNSDVCDKSNYQVSVGDDNQLTGYAWSDQTGWISFSCKNSDVCDKSNYQVSVGDDNQLTGYAWSDQAGWISFSCKNSDVCDKSNYQVHTESISALVNCSDCGKGIFNICDRDECLGCQEGCYFIDGLISGDCFACANAVCESYGGDEAACNTNSCGLENCVWEDGACKSKYSGCFGNINGDQYVNIYDLSVLAENWGKPGKSDLNNDGVTNLRDLKILTSNWGNVCK